MVRVNIKFATTVAVLLLGFAAEAAAATAAPRNSDCVNCTPRSRYDSEEVIRKIRNSRGSGDSDTAAPKRDDAAERDSGPRIEPVYRETTTPRAEPVRESAPRTETYRDSPPRNETYRDGGSRTEECPGCPPARKYDSQEVVKSSHDVDKSDVINTTTVVPVAPKYREQNHLVVHENETRLTGTVQHNNLIVEKEIRYVRRAPVYRQHYVQRQVRVVPQYVYVPIVQRQSGCGCNPPPPPVSCCSVQAGYPVQQFGYAPQQVGYANTGGYYYGY